MTSANGLDQLNHYIPYVQQLGPNCQQPVLQQAQGQLNMRKETAQEKGYEKVTKDAQGRALASCGCLLRTQPPEPHQLPHFLSHLPTWKRYATGSSTIKLAQLPSDPTSHVRLASAPSHP